MKTIALVILVSLSTFSVSAREKKAPAVALNTCISGVVVDETTGESLAGVVVELKGTDKKAYTDFDGKFVFTSVEPGSYKVSTSIVSYQGEESAAIKVNNNEFHNLNLQIKRADK